VLGICIPLYSNDRSAFEINDDRMQLIEEEFVGRNIYGEAL
jgi:hypothetical protein